MRLSQNSSWLFHKRLVNKGICEKDLEKNEERISKFIPYDQYQELLLPKSVQDCIPGNHIARALSRIIDYLNIAAIILSYDHRGTPAYHPQMLMKVLVYAETLASCGSKGLLNHLQSKNTDIAGKIFVFRPQHRYQFLDMFLFSYI